MGIDLHVHSTFSDGSMTPSELVALAARKGLHALSITDHDNMVSVPEALDAGLREGIEVLPGLELSVMHGETSIHLLGYMFDHRNLRLLEFLGQIQEGREKRNLEIFAKLAGLGIHIEKEIGALNASMRQIGRPHIAKILVKKKCCKNINEAFAQYLVPGAPAYAKRPVFQASEAIQLIAEAGGLSSLAHPLNIRCGNNTFEPIVDALTELGLDGIEAFYPTHSKKMQQHLVEYAKKNELICTGGSDYHGDFRPGTYLAGGKNVSVPRELIPLMKKRRDSRLQ